MSKILEELKEVIGKSSLPLSDQNDLFIFLPILPEKALVDLVEIFKKSPRLLKEFNENFKAKIEALVDGRDNWQKMIEKEEELLETWEEELGGKEEKPIETPESSEEERKEKF